ncbi:MAG: CDP-alcohol phosphatidyltransferase family protein [Anaerotignum sp.]|nr:CDP-alcohol phosphatidyltransferase family protein [Anaerotignum sp.]
MGLIPNIVTVARIIMAFLLLWTDPFSKGFFMLYLFCGVSDVLDGYIARRFQLTSPLGATLDSIADCVFVFIVLSIVVPRICLPLWVLLWMGGIFVIKLGTLVIGGLRYGALAFLHTYFNKAAGAGLFCFPVLYYFWGIKAAAVVCTLATLAATEELVINLSQKELQRDKKGLFMK